MKIRFISRVHYQISRPGIFSVILLRCSQKNQSTYPENIALKLLKIGHSIGNNIDNEFEQLIVNKESAKFAVSMAQALEFLTLNCNWDWRGFATAKILEEIDKSNLHSLLYLSEIEKVIYLKYFLEADGAAILEFSKVINNLKTVTRNNLLSNLRGEMNQVFINIWESYKHLSSDLKDKMNMTENIRNLKNKRDLEGWGYTYKTLIHKVQGHIFPLVDMGILTRKKLENNEVIFSTILENGKNYVGNLIKELESIEKMEYRFSRFEFFSIIANIFELNYRNYDQAKDFKLVSELIVNTYHSVKDQLTKLSSIAVISDIISTKLLVHYNVLLERPQIESIMIEIKNLNPLSLHFHVDKYGNKAFVVIS